MNEINPEMVEAFVQCAQAGCPPHIRGLISIRSLIVKNYRATEIKSTRVQNYAAAVLDAAAADSSDRRRCSAKAVATPVSD